MSKNIHVTVDDWVADEIVDARSVKNKSAYVQELLIKGWMKKKEEADSRSIEPQAVLMKKELKIRPTDGWGGILPQDLGVENLAEIA